MQVLATSFVVGGPALASLPILERVLADYISDALKESTLGPVCANKTLKDAFAFIADIFFPSVYAFVPPVESLRAKLYSYRAISNTGFRGDSFALKRYSKRPKTFPKNVSMNSFY